MTKTEDVVFKIHINGSIDEVWHEITKTDELQECFFNMQLHTDGLKPGAQIRMRSGNGKYTGVVGEVIDFDPPHRYSHTFKFTQYDDPPCTMIYELVQVETGVEFTMTMRDVPVGTKTAKQMKQGADMILKTLKGVVETGKPPLSIRLLFGIFKVMEPFTPKRSLSDQWPLDRAA